MIHRAKPPAPVSSETMRLLSSDPMPAEGAGGLTASMTPGGLEIRDARPVPFWAIITGQESGTNRYSFTQVNDGDPDNDFGATLSADFAISGGTTAVNGCVYEINGRTDVPANSTKRFLVYPAGDWSFYVFDAGAAPGSGIFGQDFSTPGGLMIWNDDTGQWAGEAKGLSYRITESRNQSIPAIGVNYHLYLQSPETHPPSYGLGILATVTHFIGFSVYNFLRTGSAIFPGITGSSTRELAAELSGKSNINGWFNTVYLDIDGKCIAMTEKFFLNNQATQGEIRVQPAASGSDVVRISSGVQNWMAHYTSAGTAGLTGTLKAGATATEGVITNLGTLTSAYTPTNDTTDRGFDANATTVDELADVLATLIRDLQAKSILG